MYERVRPELSWRSNLQGRPAHQFLERVTALSSSSSSSGILKRSTRPQRFWQHIHHGSGSRSSLSRGDGLRMGTPAPANRNRVSAPCPRLRRRTPTGATRCDIAEGVDPTTTSASVIGDGSAAPPPPTPRATPWRRPRSRPPTRRQGNAKYVRRHVRRASCSCWPCRAWTNCLLPKPAVWLLFAFLSLRSACRFSPRQ